MPDKPLKTLATGPEDQALHQDITDLIKRHMKPDTKQRVLAVASQIVGQVLAMQDQRELTKDRAMQLVAENIELGNMRVVEALMKSKGPMQ